MPRKPNPELDAKISASVREANVVLQQLNLSDEERAWAEKQSKQVFHSVTETLFEESDERPMMNAMVVAAAFAHALVMARDWAAETERQRGKL